MVPPGDGKSQRAHLPLQALVQHTPSTQKPELQSLGEVQLWPAVRCCPQLPLVQVFGDAHCVVLVQRVGHAAPAHRNGPQSAVPRSAQVPLPSQVEARCKRVAPLQAAAPHTVDGPG
jgi:hypothetical protein